MDISIIIVNYNVKHFLEQCLHSVYRALKKVEGEVFVVDNKSVDGSCQMVREKFPSVHLIENKDNLGFSKANNQAIKLSKGRYVLLLNPDTFVQEDTFEKCIKFCDENPNTGGLGVKMIDGKGNFLPESKRSLPTPGVSFFKIFGLASLFPKSKIFGKYHLGYLDKDKNHKVEILAGAFMLLRKSVLDEIGYLDETFFMYGEDIDLSYRIIKAGYENYYFADTTIIHYKGESTKKGSINYVMVFYKAMMIFAQKHFSAKNARLYSFLINFAIYLRAIIGVANRLFSRVFRPIMDFALIMAGFVFLVPYWENYRFESTPYYPKEFYLFVVPFYILIWMFFSFLFGTYEKKVKPKEIFRSIISGSILILLLYALMPESLRFSRALILLGSVWAILSFIIVRIIASSLFSAYKFSLVKQGKKRIILVGSKQESTRVSEILRESKVDYENLGRVSIKSENGSDQLLGDLSQIEEIISINKVDEIVFCSQDIQASDIIEIMLTLSNLPVDYKIAPPESISVIGSNSINTAGDLYVVDINSLGKGVNKRKKRMFDMVAGILLLLLSPFMVFIVNSVKQLFINSFWVIAGKYTWVGVSFEGQHAIAHDDFTKGVLSPADGLKQAQKNSKIGQRMIVMYAKDYKITNDILIVFRNLYLLGRKVQ